VKIPGRGFVGVGRVLDAVQSVNDFQVMTENGERPCLDILQTGSFLRNLAEDPETAEYFVRVKWLDTIAEHEAFNEVGLFGNQNSVCQPTTPKWRHTVERLKAQFPNWNSDRNRK
jgi:hypothetical protein